jgi:hypothetical protein
VRLLARFRRPLLLTAALVCVTWTVAAPVLGSALYRKPDQRPHGAAKLIFYCHLG